MKTYKRLGWKMRRTKEGWEVLSSDNRYILADTKGNKGQVMSIALKKAAGYVNGRWVHKI